MVERRRSAAVSAAVLESVDKTYSRPQREQFKPLLNELNAALRNDQNDRLSRLRRAEILCEMGRYEDAIYDIRELVGSDVETMRRTRVLRALIKRYRKQPREALAEIDQAGRGGEVSTDVALTRALILRDTIGRLHEALDEVRRVVEDDPECSEARALHRQIVAEIVQESEIKMRQGRKPQAIRLLRIALDELPEDGAIRMRCARAMLDTGRYFDSLKVLFGSKVLPGQEGEMHELSERAYDSLVRQAHAHRDDGNFDSAMQCVETVLGYAPGHPDATTAKETIPVSLIDRAAAHVQAGRLDAAALELDELLRADRSNSVGLIHRAAVRLRQGKLNRALEDADHAVNLDPRFEALLVRAKIHHEQDQPLRAFANLVRSLKLEPQHEEARNLLNVLTGILVSRFQMIARDNARYLDALAGMDRVIAGNPQSVEALLACADILRICGRVDDAGCDVDRVLHIHPRHVHALILRAKLRREAGDIQASFEDLRAALAEAPSDQATLKELHIAFGQVERGLPGWADASNLLRALEVIGKAKRNGDQGINDIITIHGGGKAGRLVLARQIIQVWTSSARTVSSHDLLDRILQRILRDRA